MPAAAPSRYRVSDAQFDIEWPNADCTTFIARHRARQIELEREHAAELEELGPIPYPAPASATRPIPAGYDTFTDGQEITDGRQYGRIYGPSIRLCTDPSGDVWMWSFQPLGDIDDTPDEPEEE